MNRQAIPMICVALGASSATAQCTGLTATDLVSAFRTGRPVAIGELQDPTRTAWTFRSTSTSGPLLVGVQHVSGVNEWGMPNRPYMVPTAGPVYSQVPQINDNPFYDRAPSFTGIMMHPGNDANEDSVAIFAPQNPITITSLEIDAEVLGDISDGVFWSLSSVIGGSPTALIGPVAASYTSSVVHSTFAASSSVLPITLNPGDTLVLRTNSGNNPFEDWANTNLRMTFSGGPILLSSPHDAAICAERTITLSTLIAGSGIINYQWEFKEGSGAWTGFGNGPVVLPVAGLIASASNADTGSVALTLEGDPDLSDVQFRCVASNSCHSVTSGAARLRSCIADRNCDGAVDLVDFFEWFNCWDTTEPCADVDGNPEIDLSDFFTFFSHWDLSC